MRAMSDKEIHLVAGGADLDDVVGATASGLGGEAIAGIAAAFLEGAGVGSIAGPVGILAGAAAGIGIYLLWDATK